MQSSKTTERRYASGNEIA